MWIYPHSLPLTSPNLTIQDKYLKCFYFGLSCLNHLKEGCLEQEDIILPLFKLFFNVLKRHNMGWTWNLKCVGEGLGKGEPFCKEYQVIAFCWESLPKFHQVIYAWKLSLGRCPVETCVLSAKDVPSGLWCPCQAEHVQSNQNNQACSPLGRTKFRCNFSLWLQGTMGVEKEDKKGMGSITYFGEGLLSVGESRVGRAWERELKWRRMREGSEKRWGKIGVREEQDRSPWSKALGDDVKTVKM